jgi:alkanesulfonate monooxygenase SsuD/methylene tetrahydromethanopterin reductase-like flavin-dependent oxidoreductase (luciferase family)
VKFTVGALLQWGGGDIQKILRWSQVADKAGMDAVVVVDHVVMGENLSAYPYGAFPGGPDGPWPEPIVLLSAIAAVTTRIRLMTGILISPLRPTALVAKQLATLDVLSNGRTDIGVGTGWQKEEYDAVGLPFEGRFTRLEEQIAACQVLWRDAPASFHGKYDNFDGIY